ncbi:MAG: DUF1761 family protein [Cyclobacteriaceae bacterium]
MEERLTIRPILTVRPISILFATLFLGAFGTVWYGVLFTGIQVESHRYTAEEYASSHPAWYMGGFLISLLIAWGLGLLVRLGGVPGWKGGVAAGLRAAVGFGIPLVSFPLVFSPLHELPLYAVGFFQIVIAWTIAGAILGSMSKQSN